MPAQGNAKQTIPQIETIKWLKNFDEIPHRN